MSEEESASNSEKEGTEGKRNWWNVDLSGNEAEKLKTPGAFPEYIRRKEEEKQKAKKKKGKGEGKRKSRDSPNSVEISTLKKERKERVEKVVRREESEGENKREKMEKLLEDVKKELGRSMEEREKEKKERERFSKLLDGWEERWAEMGKRQVKAENETSTIKKELECTVRRSWDNSEKNEKTAKRVKDLEEKLSKMDSVVREVLSKGIEMEVELDEESRKRKEAEEEERKKREEEKIGIECGSFEEEMEVLRNKKKLATTKIFIDSDLTFNERKMKEKNEKKGKGTEGQWKCSGDEIQQNVGEWKFVEVE